MHYINSDMAATVPLQPVQTSAPQLPLFIPPKPPVTFPVVPALPQEF